MISRAFVELFKLELERRKEAFLSQKTAKEKCFQELEHDKTQLRIVENRTDKTSSKDLSFPLKISAGLTNGLIKNVGDTSQKGAYFVVSSGGSQQRSQVCRSLDDLHWNDAFAIVVEEGHSLDFSVFVCSLENEYVEELVDQFSIAAASVQMYLEESKAVQDGVTLGNGNKYDFEIR